MFERPLLAESGSQNFAFPAILMSALPPEADVGLVGLRGAADDPKPTYLVDMIFLQIQANCSFLNYS